MYFDVTHDRQAELADAQTEIKGLKSRQEQLAAAHWQYIESVLKQHGESEDVIAKCGHHYKASFVHGWKHCAEEYGQRAAAWRW